MHLSVVLLVTVISLAVTVRAQSRNCGVPRSLDGNISPLKPSKSRSWGAKYVCDEGYKIKGQPDNNKRSAYVRCLRGSRWQTKFLPECEPINDCGQIPDGVNTKNVTGVVLSYPFYHKYECLPGYESNTSMVITCRADGNLTMDTGPTCHVAATTCDFPGETDAVIFPADESPYAVGSVLTYGCAAGALNTCAEMTIGCRYDGNWTGTIPPCNYP